MSNMQQQEQQEEMVQIKFSEIEKHCEVLKSKGFKIMMVYQPITGQSVATAFYKSMLSTLSGEVWSYMYDKHKIVLKPYVSPHFPIDANRNMAVLHAREKYKADYMFFMDTDQTFPPLTIPILYESLLEKQKERPLAVMAGMYFAKKDPWNGVFGTYSPWDEKTEKFRKQYEDLGLVKFNGPEDKVGQQLLWWKSINFWSKGQVFPVDIIGAGCMMMPTTVFEALEMPYFKYLPDFQVVGKQASEDMWFCAQLKKLGIPIWMNSRVSCGHLTQLNCDEALHVHQRDQFYASATLENRKEQYSKMIDLRTEEEKREWRNKHLGESREEE